MTKLKSHSASCTCCGDLLSGIYSRRRFIQTAAAAGAASILAPGLALAASGNYEAMVLDCIDPRLQEPVRKHLDGRGLTGKYSHFVIAGGGIGVVAPAFKDWGKTFWDNLGASVQLHNIQKVIVINHRDCGAAKIAYGEAAVANRDAESETHRAALTEFRKQLSEKQPKLGVETYLMALDGTVDDLAATSTRRG
jgi:carbonic anhydrase